MAVTANAVTITTTSPPMTTFTLLLPSHPVPTAATPPIGRCRRTTSHHPHRTRSLVMPHRRGPEPGGPASPVRSVDAEQAAQLGIRLVGWVARYGLGRRKS